MSGGNKSTGLLLAEIYERLLGRFGHQGWWPAEDDFEMVVGAVLTQSTSWVNVEKAIANLRTGGLLDPQALHAASTSDLAERIRPSGYFQQKAKKLKEFVDALFRGYGGSLDALFHVKLLELRERLLNIWGIGPETADSIILYGARKPIFVVDAYTRRIFSRIGIASHASSYDELQSLFMDHLPPDVAKFQEYHALIVAHGKEICRPTPRCPECPLLDLCATGSERPEEAPE